MVPYRLLYISVLYTLITIAAGELSAHFNGKDYIRYKIDNSRPTQKDKVTLRFRTTEAYGVLLYSCGSQNDFLLLELVRGKLLYTGDFGSTTETSGVHRIMLDRQYNDGIWHSVSIVRENGTHVSMTIDGRTKNYKGSMDFAQLNLDQYLFVGGMSEKARQPGFCGQCDVYRKKNYIGCLSNVRFNARDILYGANEQLTEFVAVGNVQYKCPTRKHQPEIIGFESEHSILEVSRDILRQQASHYVFEFRTFEGRGHIMTHSCTGGGIEIYLSDGKVHLVITFLGQNKAVKFTSNVTVNDGDWYTVKVEIRRKKQEIVLLVDSENTPSYMFPPNFNFYQELGVFMKQVLFGGGTSSLPGLISCYRRIEIDGELITMTSQKISHTTKLSKGCQIKDLCFPNPCQHGATCSQSRQVATCDCDKKSDYAGAKCEKCIHKRSCEEIFQSGVRKSGHYKICPNNERVFEVYCDMAIGATVVNHNLHNDTSAGIGADILPTRLTNFYYHELEYDTDMQFIKDLMKQSKTCRQYIRYDCKKSRLMYNLGVRRHIHFKGARFYDRDGDIQNYWGGSNAGNRTCACGIDKTCDRDEKGVRRGCNCDVYDSKWRFDAGFITNKSVLPVSAVQFSQLETNEASFFTVGRLECFGLIPKPTLPPTTRAPTIPTTMKPRVVNNFFNIPSKTDKKPRTTRRLPIIIHDDVPFFVLTTESPKIVANESTNATVPNANYTVVFVDKKIASDGDGEDIFWKPWLIIIAVIGSVLALFILAMFLLLFRQKCLYGNSNKPRIEIEDYNRYSTATEESSDLDFHRISTTFPTSTPEPSFGPTDDESVNLRVRTLDDLRGKRRFKQLHGWSSQTASAPTVVGGGDIKPSFSDISNHFFVNDGDSKKYDSQTNECFQDCESIAETAYSTTATDGMINGSVSDLNSEYSKNSTNFSTESSLKESEYTATPHKKLSNTSLQPAPSLTINSSDQEISPPPQPRRPPYKKPFVPPHGQKYGGVPTTDPAVKTYYPVLPINGYRDPSIRRAHPPPYGNHVVLNNNVGNFALVNGSVARIVTKRSPENTPLLIHPQTIEEGCEDTAQQQQQLNNTNNIQTLVDNQSKLLYENSRNLNGFYSSEPPSSDTRLIFGDVNSREECTREADKQIQLLKRKVIEKATSADDSM